VFGEFFSKMGLPVTKAGNPILNGSQIGKFHGRISIKEIRLIKLTQCRTPRLLNYCSFRKLGWYHLILKE
jgi:hypothetical protein